MRDNDLETLLTPSGISSASELRAWQTRPMLREPAEVTIDANGRVQIPLGILAEAGLDTESPVLAYSDGDGRIVLRRLTDAIDDLMLDGQL